MGFTIHLLRQYDNGDADFDAAGAAVDHPVNSISLRFHGNADDIISVVMFC